jgi:hypothetical protein
VASGEAVSNSFLIEAGKRLLRQHSPSLMDTRVSIVTVNRSGTIDSSGNSTYVKTTVWTGKGLLVPNLPRYERDAVATPVGGVEERRVVYYLYLPWTAPVSTVGLKIEFNSRVYELIKEPLPVGGETPSVWRLDLGAPLD